MLATHKLCDKLHAGDGGLLDIS